MTPQSITTSLEVSKQLKEAGYNQKNKFKWLLLEDKKWYCDIDYVPHFIIKDEVSAPTASELMEMLPEGIHTYKIPDEYVCESNHPDYFPEGEDNLFFTADTEADARAKMWLYLNSNNLLNTK